MIKYMHAHLQQSRLFTKVTYSSGNITWTDKLTGIRVEEFKQKPGPKVTIPDIVKEIFLFFTPTLLELIVEESNRYAADCMGTEKYEK